MKFFILALCVACAFAAPQSQLTDAINAAQDLQQNLLSGAAGGDLAGLAENAVAAASNLLNSATGGDAAGLAENAAAAASNLVNSVTGGDAAGLVENAAAAASDIVNSVTTSSQGQLVFASFFVACGLFL